LAIFSSRIFQYQKINSCCIIPLRNTIVLFDNGYIHKTIFVVVTVKSHI